MEKVLPGFILNMVGFLNEPSSMSSSPEGWRRLSTAKSSGQVLAEYGAEN